MQLEQAASGRGFALSAAGLGGLGAVHWNLGAPELYEQVLRRGEALLARDGALVAATGARTGRSPQDRFIVEDGFTLSKGEAERLVESFQELQHSLRTTEEEVRRTERLLASVVRSVDDCIFTTDTEGRLVTVNPAGQRLLVVRQVRRAGPAATGPGHRRVVAPGSIEDLVRQRGHVVRTRQPPARAGTEGQVEQQLVLMALDQLRSGPAGPDRLTDPAQSATGAVGAGQEIAPERDDPPGVSALGLHADKPDAVLRTGQRRPRHRRSLPR